MLLEDWKCSKIGFQSENVLWWHKILHAAQNKEWILKQNPQLFTHLPESKSHWTHCVLNHIKYSSIKYGFKGRNTFVCILLSQTKCNMLAITQYLTMPLKNIAHETLHLDEQKNLLVTLVISTHGDLHLPTRLTIVYDFLPATKTWQCPKDFH